MILNLEEAEQLFERLLRDRQISIVKRESRVKPGNTRFVTNADELYHVKFTKSPYRPHADKVGPARELHLKLHFAIDTFQVRSIGALHENEIGTMVGIDEDLLLHLVAKEQDGFSTYIVTILEREIALWISSMEFYSFVMRYDTFIKYPRSGVPVCYVPTGYFLTWSDPRRAFPARLVGEEY